MSDLMMMESRGKGQEAPPSMAGMPISDLVSVLPDVHGRGSMGALVTGIAYDSRRVERGHLFVAVKGLSTDGNTYVVEAQHRGAIGCVSESHPPEGIDLSWIRVTDARSALADLARRFYGDPTRELKVVGITGTKGKTTTSYLVDSVLESAGLTFTRLGTVDYRVGVATWKAERTTPESVDLQRILRQSIDAGCTHAILEISSHSLAMHRVKGCRFSVCCFTNLSRDHLDFHPDFESYFQAKQKLFLGDEVEGPDHAVINISDTWGRRLHRDVACPTTTFGLESDADVRPEEAPRSMNPLRFEVRTPRGRIPIESGLLGKGNLFNILSTVAICQSINLTNEVIASGIQHLKGIPGRLELIDCGQPFHLIVDYAHTDAALENLLRIARELAPKRIITIFGCGGDRDKTKRPLMGEVAARLSDILIVTSDNPRSEDPDAIIAEIEKGIQRVTSRYQKYRDRMVAITEGLRQAREGDVVLLAGKGHEIYQETGGGKVPFDDRVVSRKLLLMKLEGTL